MFVVGGHILCCVVVVLLCCLVVLVVLVMCLVCISCWLVFGMSVWLVGWLLLVDGVMVVDVSVCLLLLCMY